MTIFLELLEVQTLKHRVELKDQLEIGRCNRGESLYGSERRLAVAEHECTSIPRRWFVVTLINEWEIAIRNIHPVHVILQDGGPLKIPPGETSVLRLSAVIEISLGGGTKLKLRIVPGNQPQAALGSTENEPIRTFNADRSVLTKIDSPPENSINNSFTGTILAMRPRADSKAAWEPAAVVALLEKALSVVTSAAGSDKFLEAAVQAAVEIVGLDRAVIVGRQAFDAASAAYFTACTSDSDQSVEAGQAYSVESILKTVEFPTSEGCDRRLPDSKRLMTNGWFPWVSHLKESRTDWEPPGISLTVLQRANELGKTQICDAKNSSSEVRSQVTSSVVATPILDRNQELVAVFYGDRWSHAGQSLGDITDVEALLLEVFASAVAGGLARQVEEKSRAELSEFFSPRVASLLVQRRDLLAGRDAEVSVLFCDISGFSSISERFGAQRTIQWINDVLTELSKCVVDRDGVLVDYVGDELFAMWGAPEPQPDHATRAISAAMAMLDAVETLRCRASEEFASELDVRIGVNSGPARVGNVGSRLKFKYGVLGHSVNIGSRVQGACKHLGVRCLMTGATSHLLQEKFSSRRIAKLQVVGIGETVDVYEVVRDADDVWRGLRDEYEMALGQFEAGTPGETVHRLGKLLQQFPDDRPSAILLGKAALQLTDPKRSPEILWRLDSK